MYLNSGLQDAQSLQKMILSDCRLDQNKAVTNDGQVCANIFRQNGGGTN